MKITLKSWLSRVGIVAISAILVEVISIIQYQRIRRIMDQGMTTRSRIAMGATADKVAHLLEITETTMRENMHDLRHSLKRPDDVYLALQYTIDDNPNIVGGCLSFEPDYYSSKGLYYEPYVYKKGDGYVYEQLGSPQHNYFDNPAYRKVVETRAPSWSDPYVYESENKTSTLITYSCPVFDESGELAGVCGLDMDVSWLGDTLNTRQRQKYSFLMLLAQDGKLVAAPPSDKTSPEEVNSAMQMISEGRSVSADKRLTLRSIVMDRDPFWQVVHVYHMDVVMAPMRKMRNQQMVLVLLGLLILFFMIERFARNEKKLRDATAEQARISGELSVAREIQQEMIPDKFPPFIHGSLEPALEVGGDLFDFYIRDGKLLFCMGDVSGKGVPAAMLMSMAHSLFRVTSMRYDDMSKVLFILNDQICRRNYSSMFVTFQAGCLDLYTGELRIANAGHDKPFLLSSSGASMVPLKSNLPLGVFPDMQFPEETFTLSPGSGLFLYTDGLTEAKNLQRMEFGRDRVEHTLRTCISSPDSTPRTIVETLSRAAHCFAGEAPQSDDMAMLMFKFDAGDCLRDTITLTTDTADVTLLGNFIKTFCEKLQLDHRLQAEIRLAVEEAVVNVMNYAYPEDEAGTVTINADSNRREVRFTIIDSGVPFDPTAVLAADTTLDALNRPIGGLGVHLTKKLMDSVSYSRRKDKNIFTLTKTIV